MNKNIAVVVGIIVVLATFFILPNLSTEERTDMGNLSLFFPTLPSESAIKITTLENTSAGIEAWTAFEQYREYARTNNLPGLRSLSYQLSKACSEPVNVEECNTLMTSVYLFSKDFKQSDFHNVAYDDKQVVMSTDYLVLQGAEEPMKTVLYFVRESGEPKLLGIRFCFGEAKLNETCVETDKVKRDQDNNGWWDDVEALFK